MEIFVKIYNGSLIRVFDTKKNKKKEVVLTPVQDNQKEAEVEFFARNKKVEVVIFKNLPPAKARVLNLPVTIELIERNKISLQYEGSNSSIEKHELSFKEETDSATNEHNIRMYKEYLAQKKKKSGKKVFFVLIPIFIIAALLLLAGLFLLLNKNKIFASGDDKKTNNENKILQSDNEKKTAEKKYTKDSLEDVIKKNAPINFIKDKAVLLDGENKKLGNIISYLKNYEKLDIVINGHTQNDNKPENELALSVERAEVIKNAILSNTDNIDIVINTKGFGSSKPLIPNPDVSLRYKNRRIEIIINSAEGRE